MPPDDSPGQSQHRSPDQAIDTWLKAAVADAEQRGLPELKPLLEGLAATLRTLRAAGFTVPSNPERPMPREPRG